MNKRTLLKVLLIMLCAGAYGALSADVPVNGKIQYTTAADSDKGKIYRNAAAANVIFLKAFEKTTVSVNLQSDYDSVVANSLETTQTDQPMSAHSRVFLREASITQDFYFKNVGLDSFSFKGGLFTEKWGYTDYYNPVNVINPQDYSFHLMREWRERAMGVYALKSSLYFSQHFFIEGLFNPIFESDNEASASFASHKQSVISSSVQSGALNGGTGYPDQSLSAAAYAARIGVKSRDFDCHLMYYDGYDHASSLDYAMSGTDVTVSRDYSRQRMVGADFMANLAWNINFKGEAGYFLSGKNFELNEDGLSEALSEGESTVKESPLLDYTVGFEVVKNFPASAFVFNFEFNENIIIDHNSSLEEKKITNRILGELQYSFVRKTVIVKTAGLYCLEDGDLGAQFELGLKPAPVYAIKLGYWLFHPFTKEGETGLFGSYKDQDFVYLSGEVVF